LGPTDEFTVRGSGPIGPYWAPIPYSWPNTTTRRGLRRKRKTRHWKLLSSVTGRIDIYLKQGRTETPNRGAAAWFADSLGLFTKQTERYSVREFLKRYAKFLSSIRHRNVLLVEIDYDDVSAGEANQGPDDLDESLARAYDFLASHGEGKKVLFSTFGRTNHGLKQGLEITMEAQYNRKHGHGKPAMEIRILAIPSILVKKPREADRDYEARTKKLFLALSDVGKEKFARRYENTTKVLFRDYEHQLYKFFEVAKSTRWLHLAWGKTAEDLKTRVNF
jgi:hypothetical protein